MAPSTRHKLKATLAALVDLAAGPGTAARAAASAAVRLEAEGKADTIAVRLEAQAASALKQTRARLKSTGRAHAGTAPPDTA